MAKTPVPVAQYLRMSTDQQQYSIVNQAAAIAIFADRNRVAMGAFLQGTYTITSATPGFANTGYPLGATVDADFVANGGTVASGELVPDPVPESGTIALMGLGLLGLAFHLRRRALTAGSSRRAPGRDGSCRRDRGMVNSAKPDTDGSGSSEACFEGTD